MLRVIGEHMVENALAAAACALALGVRVEQCARGLESYSGRRSRMELRRSPDGLLVLDDSYNASPHSMQAALRTARHIAAGRRAVAVLGPMVELGEFARSAHEDVGRLVVALGFDLVITVGDEARAIAWRPSVRFAGGRGQATWCW